MREMKRLTTEGTENTEKVKVFRSHGNRRAEILELPQNYAKREYIVLWRPC